MAALELELADAGNRIDSLDTQRTALTWLLIPLAMVLFSLYRTVRRA